MPVSRRLVRPHPSMRVLPVLLLLIAATLTVLTAPPAQAAVVGPFIPVFTQSTSGGILIRGNTLLTCPPATSACEAARSTVGGSATSGMPAKNNNNYTMANVNVDAGTAGRFNSSRSTVTLPTGSSVLFAALVWSGRTGAGPGGAPAPDPTAKGSVLLKAPGTSTFGTVSSSRTLSSGDTYQGYADVTSQVQAGGSGDWTVGNVQTGTGQDRSAGWSLAIAYADPTAPLRNLTIFAGLASLTNTETVDIPVSGFTTPPSGAVRTTLGAVVYEGDAGSTGDQFLLGPNANSLTNVQDALHASTNVFNSVISTSGVDPGDRSPAYNNNLGFDASTFQLNNFLPNGSSSAVLRLTTTSETYYPGLISFATDLYAPRIDLAKSATYAKALGNTQSGALESGDTVTYTITGSNAGSDAAAPTVLTDEIPAGTTYVPGSLTVGGSAATDASGDDLAKYSGVDDQITVNLGTGATSSTGGQVAVGASVQTVTFQVVVDQVTGSETLTNTARIDYTGVTSGQAVFGASNTLLAVAFEHRSDLGVTLTSAPATVQRGAGTAVTQHLTVTNNGPYDEPDAVVNDSLPAGATIVSSTPSAGSCTTASVTVTCHLGAMTSGATATVDVVVRLDGSTRLATSVAAVRGANSDPTPANDSATVTTRVNTAPVAVPDSTTTTNGSATFDPSGNDTDADPDALAVTSVSGGTRGFVVLNTNGTVTYTAAAGQAGSDSFSYVVSDGRGGSDAGTVTVTIANRPPTAQDDTGTTVPGASVDIDVLANDTDPNIPTIGSQSLTVTSVTQPPGGAGTVTHSPTSVTFNPSSSFVTGTTTFDYTVLDGAGGTDTATVTVTAANVGPQATNDVATTPYRTSVDVDVLGNDGDPNGDPLVLTGVTGAAHGSATVVNGQVHYVPAVGWSGSDTLTYSIADTSGVGASGTLTVTTLNGAPSAGGFASGVPGGRSTTIDVLTHVSDPNGDALVVIGAGPAAHGSVSVNGAGAAVYTPDPAYRGTDSFQYTVGDGNGGTATATVTLTVANQPPELRDDVALVPVDGSVDIYVLVNDTDANGDTLAITGTSAPSHGAVTTNPNGRLTYRPGRGYIGPDSFSYTVADGVGGTSTAQVQVTVPNRPPTALPETRSLVGQVGGSIAVDVIANDTDPDGDLLHLDSVASPTHGSASVIDGRVVYTPDPLFAGNDSVTYLVGDTRGGFASGTLTVHVVNRAPVAVPDRISVDPATTTPVDVLGNDSDPDGETVSVSDVDLRSVAGGTVTFVGGRLFYTPPAGHLGEDSFGYTILDPRGGIATSTVSLRVGNRAPVPVIETPVLTGAAGASRTIDVLGNDEDPDGDLLRLFSVGRPAHGTTRIVYGKVVYTPDLRFAGIDSFTDRVGDGHGGTATQTVRVTVSNRDPVAKDDAYRVENRHPRMLEVLANDSDPDGDPLRLLSVTRPDHGSAVIADGELTYTAVDRHVGVDSFDYTVRDARGGTTTATVTVTVSSADPTGANNPLGTGDPTGTSGAKGTSGPSGAKGTMSVVSTDPVAGVFEIVENGRSLDVLSVVDASDEPLPDTGGPAGWLPMMGLGLLFVGAGLLVGRRLAAGFRVA